MARMLLPATYDVREMHDARDLYQMTGTEDALGRKTKGDRVPCLWRTGKGWVLWYLAEKDDGEVVLTSQDLPPGASAESFETLRKKLISVMGPYAQTAEGRGEAL